MSSIYTHGRSDNSEPRRPLHSDFTLHALRRATTAKRRAARWHQIKELFSMKSFTFLRNVPGLAATSAVIVVSSVGVYALSNWFGGEVPVPAQNNGVFSVDLSSCKGNLPPGVELTDDPHDIEFKIMGSPHISAQDLQRQLLAECENSAVADFYRTKFPDSGISSDGHPISMSNASKYLLLSGKIERVNSNGTLTVSSTGAKSDSFVTHSFTLGSNATFYDQGQSSSVTNLKAGDTIKFVAYSASQTAILIEGSSILSNDDVQLVSVFKTKYNDGAYSSFDYETNNIMPLDAYNQLPNHKLYTP